MTVAVTMLGLTAWADQTTGEWAMNIDGTPAKSGQATTDHLFVRGAYDDGVEADNMVEYINNGTQLVWFWLDDDAIYQNTRVQALTPIAYNQAGDKYDEITYNSFQCELYLPEHFSLQTYINDEGEEIDFVQGDRLPTSSELLYQKMGTSKVIDGVTYSVYRIICTSTAEYGCHFSSKNAAKYQANGALKKDDGALFGLYVSIDDIANAVGEMPDMIIANLEFGFREAFTNTPVWEPNDYRFIYCTGGNNESQRFQFYQRVKLLGKTEAELTEEPVISYTMSSGAVTITATGEGDITLSVDGQQVSNPCTIERGDQDRTVMVTATARAVGKISNQTSTTIVIPARPGASGNNQLTMPVVTMAEAGKPFDLPVAMENSADISALQCDVFLPDGITLAPEGVELAEDRVSSSHSATVRDLGNGAFRVLIASPVAALIGGNEGELFTLHLNVAPGVADGNYNIMLGNIVLADADAVTYTAPDVDAMVTVKSYAKGDANGDGLVNVGDYVTTANYILGLEPDPFIYSAADVDESGTIDVGDMVGIISIVLGDYTVPDNAPSNGEVEMSGHATSMGNDHIGFTINLKNEMALTAWQMDLQLPEGVTLDKAELTSRVASHRLSVNELGDGSYRLLGFSAVNSPVAGSEGALLTLELSGTEPDELEPILVKNILLAETDMTIHRANSFLMNGQTISVNEQDASMRIYSQGSNIVVETPVDTTVDIIMANGMSRSLVAKAGVNTYPAAKGLHIVRANGKVAKLNL